MKSIDISNKTNIQAVHDFASAINEGNVDKICSLMTNDHKFIDAHGNEFIGKDTMRAAWAGYFQWFPDYKIDISEIFPDGNTIAAFGFASGTYKGKITSSNEHYWRLPAAWKVIVTDNKIKLWQVYADTKIPFDIIGKNT